MYAKRVETKGTKISLRMRSESMRRRCRTWDTAKRTAKVFDATTNLHHIRQSPLGRDLAERGDKGIDTRTR